MASGVIFDFFWCEKFENYNFERILSIDDIKSYLNFLLICGLLFLLKIK